MSHAPTFAANEVPFCQRNNRVWVMLLAGSAVLVLALAVWLAIRDGKLSKPHFQHRPDPIATAAAPAPAPPAPGGTQVAWTPPPQAQAVPAAAAIDRTINVASPAGGNGIAMQLQGSFNHAADEIRPSVVNINAVRPSRPWSRAATQGPQFVDPFDGVPDKVIGQMAFESVGSGVIVDPAGYVVTNDHLVHGATSIMVTRFNQTDPLRATLVATEPRRDLALLKIEEGAPFQAAKLANSSKVEVGDWVLAVGNPFGLGHTVTAGIVSSRRSSIQIAGITYKDLIQTDAPINQGSSGGPLVNLKGKVVGINTAIYAPTGVFNGTGFAIPSNHVGAFVSRNMPARPAAMNGRQVAMQLPVAGGMVGAGGAGQPAATNQTWLGIQGSPVTPLLGSKLGLARAEGVFVNSVTPGSPAAEAELRRGDVITEIAGWAVNNPSSMSQVIGALPPGLTVPVVVSRNGNMKTRRIKLGFQKTPAVGR